MLRVVYLASLSCVVFVWVVEAAWRREWDMNVRLQQC